VRAIGFASKGVYALEAAAIAWAVVVDRAAVVLAEKLTASAVVRKDPFFDGRGIR